MQEQSCPECGASPYAEHTNECSLAQRTWVDEYRAGKPMFVMPVLSREDGSTDDRALLADVAFNRHSMNDGEHVSPSDNGMVQVGTDGINVQLVQRIDEDALRRTLSAAVRATVGLDMSQPVEAEGDWEEMLKGGLQTALETQVIVFGVSGVSRTCTHQLVRSRRAAFHQQSQRAGYMGDTPECRMPESVYKDPIARDAFMEATLHAWRAYRRICDRDISYQDARFVLPEGTTNFILLEYPVREFLNVYAYRGCSMFQWEIVQVMRECKRVLVEAHPWIEPYVKISCEKTGPVKLSPKIGTCTCGAVGTATSTMHDTSCGVYQLKSQEVEHHCTFQGWEDVEGQCDFPWAKQEARTFKPEFHRITKERI
jgi:flavin-dependent thymidylate synthase